MADFNKVDGLSQPAESFSGDLDFFTVTVGGTTPGSVRSDGTPGIDDAGDPNDLEQHLFDKLVEAISQKAQPIILTGGTTGTTVFNVVVEHSTVWTEAGATDNKAESLDTVLEAIVTNTKNDAGTAVFSGTTIAVVFAETL